jgi:transposase
MAGSHDTEVWRPVVGYEGLYEVSDRGRVRGVDRCGADGRRVKGKLLNPNPTHGGYFAVTLRKSGIPKTLKVHKLVLRAFVGPCPTGMEARHFPDRDPTNNRLCNLSWASHAQNCADRSFHGTQRRGDTHGRSKISSRDLERIFDLRESGLLVREIAKQIGLSSSQVKRILTRKSWVREIENEGLSVLPGTRYRGERHDKAKLSPDDVKRMIAMKASGVSQKHISEKFGVCQSHVSRIVNGKYWRHVS